MKSLMSARYASLAWCVLGVAAANVGAQTASSSGGTASPGGTPSVAAPGATPGASHKPGPKSVASKRTTAAAPASIPPRPQMGLKLAMTQPKSRPMTKGQLPASPYQNTHGTEKSQQYYSGIWGVDKLKATSTNSGNLIKFSYRVLQPKRAKVLGDHESAPEMVGIRSNAVLHIPTMEKIGQLRQMSAAEANKDYWMVFSNKGNLIKPGDEVSVIIGKFHADGLIVE